MVEVTEAIGGATELWLSDKVWRELKRLDSTVKGRFLKQLKRCCDGGFVNYEGMLVVCEWSEVYRIGFGWSLFRIIGFYEDGTNKTRFIGMDAYLKHGQKLSAADRDRINATAAIKKNRAWRKVVGNEQS